MPDRVLVGFEHEFPIKTSLERARGKPRRVQGNDRWHASRSREQARHGFTLPTGDQFHQPCGISGAARQFDDDLAIGANSPRDRLPIQSHFDGRVVIMRVAVMGGSVRGRGIVRSSRDAGRQGERDQFGRTDDGIPINVFPSVTEQSRLQPRRIDDRVTLWRTLPG